MKYRVVESANNRLVVMEDGGIADIRELDEVTEEGYETAIEYYQSRFTLEDLQNDKLWDSVGEGKMYTDDCKTHFTDQAHIQSAIEWLDVCGPHERDDTIWDGWFGEDDREDKVFFVRAEEQYTAYQIKSFKVVAKSKELAVQKILNEDEGIENIDTYDTHSDDYKYINQDNWVTTEAK